jgi:hypothetical protein
MAAVVLMPALLCGALSCRQASGRRAVSSRQSGAAQPAGSGSRTKVAPAVALRNSDIRWSGTLIGLYPFIEGEPAKELLATGPSAIPELVAALDDPDRWVAAHVLLTQLARGAGDKPPIKGSASERWWGLKVDIFADGRIEFDPADRPVLQKYWRDWMARHGDDPAREAKGVRRP